MDLHLAFRRTSRLAALLDAWDARIGLEDATVQHPWTGLALWPAARGGTVAGSTGIEGNPLTPADVDEVLSGGSVAGSRTDIREVLNYNATLDLANRSALRSDFEWTAELLRRLNAEILAGLEDDEHGEYRREPVTVGGVFEPPAWQLVPGLVAELVDWCRTPATVHPLLRAGLLHLNVVSIHPWTNGNGRTARVAGSLMLMRSGVGAPELLNIESEIRASRRRYFTVLQETQGPTYAPDRHAATPWLEYFAEICVDRLDGRNRLAAAVPGDLGLLLMELGPRSAPELPAILLGARLAPVRTARIAESLGVSPGRARAILAELSTNRWLVPIGDRRGRRYGPSARLLALPLRTPALMDALRNPASHREATD